MSDDIAAIKAELAEQRAQIELMISQINQAVVMLTGLSGLVAVNGSTIEENNKMTEEIKKKQNNTQTLYREKLFPLYTIWRDDTNDLNGSTPDWQK